MEILIGQIWDGARDSDFLVSAPGDSIAACQLKKQGSRQYTLETQLLKNISMWVAQTFWIVVSISGHILLQNAYWSKDFKGD